MCRRIVFPPDDGRPRIHCMMTSSRDELSATPSEREPAIEIDGLHVVRGGRPAVRDVTVRIARGTITGLLGPSGCGKTTLMRCIVGTQIVAKGTVTVLGHPAGSAPLRHRVGYVTQNPTIYDDLRVIDNVRYFAALYGTSPRCRRSGRRRGRPRRPAQRILRQSLGRPAHTRVARMCAGRRTRTAGPRRADRRTRPGPPRRSVAAVQRPRRERHHACGLQPRHGRGGSLR